MRSETSSINPHRKRLLPKLMMPFGEIQRPHLAQGKNRYAKIIGKYRKKQIGKHKGPKEVRNKSRWRAVKIQALKKNRSPGWSAPTGQPCAAGPASGNSSIGVEGVWRVLEVSWPLCQWKDAAGLHNRCSGLLESGR